MDKPEWMQKFEDTSISTDERLLHGLEFSIPTKDGKVVFDKVNETLNLFDRENKDIDHYYYLAVITCPVWFFKECRWFFDDVYSRAKALDTKIADELMSGYKYSIEDFEKNNVKQFFFINTEEVK